ncbi:MAG: hypothetical protein ACOVN0_00985 [Niveispirillum sp.]|uniref:hypothetical protein n=1 Tax=Niveispirillum sp. TaxID=1917217 RepID=UPI003BA60F7A
MAYAFDEDYTHLPPPPVRAEVEADIIDWRSRLTDLMDGIRSWASEIPGVEVQVGEVGRLERKMELVGIHEPVRLPALTLRKIVGSYFTPLPAGDQNPYINERLTTDDVWLSVWPDARWVIGTRGQIWLQSNSKFYTVADLGEHGHPDWRLLQKGDDEFRPFTKEIFQALVTDLK